MSEQHRLVALKLFALAAADREWVLGRLAQAEREIVLPLLADLENIGFDRTQFAQMASSLDAPPVLSTNKSRPLLASNASPAVSRLERYLVTRVLASEPGWIRESVVANLCPELREPIASERNGQSGSMRRDPLVLTAMARKALCDAFLVEYETRYRVAAPRESAAKKGRGWRYRIPQLMHRMVQTRSFRWAR